MFRYDRNYDYGLRGDPSGRRDAYADRRARGYPDGFERRADPQARMGNRVTARYTYDYVFGGRGERYPRNFNAYTGDYPGRMRDPDSVPLPYMTRGGTRTSRGTLRPDRYDLPDYGPDYGGRYPDEL